ncbi:AAA family ATPase [Natrinema sp. H-ect4]|uniref:AAA family ATPase n=1 Tax=Natrinema sp. H-ect4 TaxID=3242699 RepID=UPI0035A923A4
MRLQLIEANFHDFKSIGQGSVGFSDISVLIGKNNSGKSNVIDAFASLKELEENRPGHDYSQQWFLDKAMGKNIDSQFQISLVYRFPEERRQSIYEGINRTNSKHRKAKSRIENSSILNKVKYEISVEGTGRRSRNKMFYIDDGSEWQEIDDFYRKYDVVDRSEIRETIEDSIKTWRFVDPFRVPRDIDTAGYTTELESDGTNLVKVLNSLQTNHPEMFEDIASSYVDIMDGVTDISVEYDTDLRESDMTIVVNEENFDIKFKSSDISSGSKEILVLLTQIYWASENSDILFLEEPELHLHPGAERKVFNLIRDLVSKKDIRVVISTHSDVFVDQTRASSITRVDRQDRTVLRSIEPDEVDVELQDLGYEKSGLLQSEAVIFVEGLSDKRILKQFGSTAGLNFDEFGVEVVELEGIDRMRRDSKSLVKLLSSFNIPHLFIIDKHDITIEEAKGQLYDSMARDDGNEWWDVSLDNIFVWNAYGIEQYLLNSRAIAEDFEMSQETVQQIIDENEGVDDKEIVLQKIYAEEHSELENPEGIFNKATDGLYISKRMNANELPEDVLQALVKIADRLERVDLNDLEPEIPESLLS